MRADPARGGGGGRRRPRDLEAALARLEALDVEGLAAAWQARFETAPPAALPPRLLLLALAQYAGRLHRLHPAKREVVIYDYVDSREPMLARMAAKRRAGYRNLGYTEAAAEEAVAREG